MRDKVSGFTGVATTETHFLTGNVQFTLTPQAGGIFGREAVAFDIHQLEYAGAGIDIIEAPENTGIALGEKVKDIVMGIEGIATLKTIFMNGCVYYTIIHKSPKDVSDPKESFIEYKRLTRVGAGVTAAIAKRNALEASDAATGGPAYSVPKRG